MWIYVSYAQQRIRCIVAGPIPPRTTGGERVLRMKLNIRRPCPHCSSTEVFRSHRRGPFEKYLFSIIGMRPYRCIKCDSRFYGFGPATEQAADAHLKTA